jgi:hypothetical protein
MPIFDNELLDDSTFEDNAPVNTALGSPELYNPSLNMAMPSMPGTSTQGDMSLDRISKLNNQMQWEGFQKPISFVNAQTLKENEKYPMYKRDIDLENVYGLQQSAWSQMGNGVAKMFVRGGGTFVQGFMDIPNAIDAIKKRDFAELSGDVDGFEGTIDQWVENMENYFPNYYTRKEQDSPWIAAIPFAPGSANFWGDKIIKNIGFTAGAIANGIVTGAVIGAATAGLGALPYAAAKIGKFGLAINKIFATAGKGEKFVKTLRNAGVAADGLIDVQKAAQVAQYAKMANGFKYKVTVLGSAMTEAGVESREGFRMVKQALVEQRDLDMMGAPMTREEEAEIDKMATDAMNVRFGVNMALLTVSNSVMFGNMFKSALGMGAKSAEGAIGQAGARQLGDLGKVGIKDGGIDTFEKVAAKNIAERGWNFVKPKLPTIFSEGVYEEGGQFAAEQGTYDYFTRKYKNLNNNNNKQAWNSVDETMSSAYHGLSEQFSSEEGLQNMFIGAISALLMTGGQNAADSLRGKGKNKRLKKALGVLNGDLLSGTLQNKYDEAVTSAAIAKDMEAANESGDIFKYKNLQHNMFFTMVNNRAKAGMHEYTVDQLNMLKDLSEEEFEKTFGIKFSQENQKTVSSYVDGMISKANKINEDVQVIQETFKNPYKPVENAETAEEIEENMFHYSFEGWKDELAAIKSNKDFMDIRVDEINNLIMEKHPSLSGNVVADITSKEGLNRYSEEYLQDANMLEDTITESTPARERRKIREKIKTLKSLSSKANLLGNRIQNQESDQFDLFSEILNYENNSRNIDGSETILPQDVVELMYNGSDINRARKINKDLGDKAVALSSKEGMTKYLESMKNVVDQEVPEEGDLNYENEKKEATPLEIGIEYAFDKSKEVGYKKLPDGRWVIELPSGEKRYVTSEPRAKAEVELANRDIKNMSKVKVLAINDNGTVTVEDASGDIFDILPDRLKGYKRLATTQEKLAKQEEDIDKAQQKVENQSGTIATIPSEAIEFDGEGRLKDATIAHISSTTDSVTWAEEEGREVAPHVTRSFTFLENIANHPKRDKVKAMLVTSNHLEMTGLTGLDEMSDPDATPESRTNVDTGFVAQVWVIKEGKSIYFLDQEGNKLNKVGTKADLGKVVFQTMPTTGTVFSNGKPRYRKSQKDEFELNNKRWAKYRETLFEEKTNPPLYDFSVSRGIANQGAKDFRTHVSNVFVNEDTILKQEGLVFIPTNNQVIYQQQSLKVPNGVPMIVYKDKLEYLKNRTFSKDEALTLFRVIEAFAADLTAQAEAGGKISKLGPYSTFLQNVLYWSSKSDVTSDNQIKIDLKEMTLVIGKENYPLDKISEMHPTIIAQLQTVYSSVNNTTLTKSFNKPFTEYYATKEGLGTRVWANYQSYLLSSKFPDGSARNVNSTPLTTNILPATDAVPYSFKQKYATLQSDSEILPEVKIEKPAETQPAADTQAPAGTTGPGVTLTVKDGDSTADFTVNNNQLNIKMTGSGPVSFKANIDENGEPTVDIQTDVLTAATLHTAGDKAENIIVLISYLKPIYPDVNFSVLDGSIIASMYVTTQIKQQLKDAWEEREAAKKTEEAEVVAKKASTKSTESNKNFTNAPGDVKLYFDSKTKIGDEVQVIFPGENTISKGKLVDYHGEVGVLFEDGADGPQNWGPDVYEGISVPKTKKNFGGKGRGSLKRIVGVSDSSDRMSEEDMIHFRAWAAEYVPNIPIEVLEKLITINSTQKAWGVFENGVVKFVKGGLRGTEYHEVGHAIFNGMLSEEQQIAIIAQEKERSGSFTDRATKKKVRFDEATDKQIEERIMDDFADAMVGKLPIRNLSDLVKYLYKLILDFVKYFDNKILKNDVSLKEQMFKDINEGRFRDVKPRVLKDSYYSAAPGLTDPQTHEFVQDMTMWASSLLFGEDKALLFNPQEVNAKELFDAMEEIYSSQEEANENGETKRELMSDEAWEDLQKRTKDNLRVLHSINFKEDASDSEQDSPSINNENSNKNEYADSPFSLDVKKSSTWPVKFTMATLHEVEAAKSGLLIEMPPMKTSSIGGVKLLNFSRAFATMLSKAGNTNSVKKFEEKLRGLAAEDPAYLKLFHRVGGKVFEDANGDIKGIIDYDSFTKYDWRLFVQFYQTFTRQHPNAIVQFKNATENYSANINEYASARETLAMWTDKIKMLADDPTSLIFYDKVAKHYRVKRLQPTITEIASDKWKVEAAEGITKFFETEKEAKIFARTSGIPTRTIKDNIKFLNRIGIDYTHQDVMKLSKLDRAKFIESVATMYVRLAQSSEIMTLNSKTLQVNGPLNTLSTLYVKTNNPNKDNTHFGVDGKRRGNYSESNYSSVFEDEWNEAGTLDELLVLRPELKDAFSQGSLILKKGGEFIDKDGKIIKNIKIEYIQGIVDSMTGDNTATSNFTPGDRFLEEINQNINGKYYMILPADSATEWMIDLGHFYTYDDLVKNKWKKILPTFTNYLLDDVRLALDSGNRDYLKHVKNSGAKKLRFFDQILPSSLLNKINDMLAVDTTTYEDVKKVIDAKDTQEAIMTSVSEMLMGMRSTQFSTLMENGKIYEVNEDEYMMFGLDSAFLTKNELDGKSLSEENVASILDFVIINQVIANIEMHKVLFGDPAQFKNKDGILDELKRLKSFLSPRKKTFDTPEYNSFLNTEYNKVNGIELQYDEKQKDYGYHTYKPYAKVTIFSDMIVAGSLANISEAFGEVDETDAFSWLMDGTYKEIMLKNGQWTDVAEEWHQWQMAYTRQNVPGYTYTNKALESHDKKLVQKTPPSYTLKVLKPIVTGTSYNTDYIRLNLHKTAQMPVYYSMVEGTTMEKMYTKMFKEGIDYAIVESGAKVGTETSTHDIYNGDGTFNVEPYNNSTEVSWKSYGIQVETESEGNKSQTRGSQLTKMSSMNLFENGVPYSKDPAVRDQIQNAYNRNTRVLNELHQDAYNRLLSRLGITEDADGNFLMEDKTVISSTLMYEMLRRDASDNLKDSLELDNNNQFKIPFEAAPSYVNIRDIIYSMIDKSLIRPKMSGGSHVQVPSTMFESALKGKALARKTAKGWEKITKKQYDELTDKQKESVMLTDDTLKFYEDEDGKRYCEILLPHWFKTMFGKDKTDEEVMKLLKDSPDFEKIMSGIGFRIPSQALSSVEVFRVKGFLPQYMGSTVVVPSEITMKAGSDFDIDKLNMYLKSIYKDNDGRIRLVQYKNNEADTKAFFGKVYDDSVAASIKQLTEKDAFRDRLFRVLDSIENSDEEAEYYEILDEEDLEFFYTHEGMISAIDAQAEAKGLYASEYIKQQIAGIKSKTNKLLSAELREAYINKKWTQALENEYYDSLEELLTLEQQFEHLISPVDDGGYKAISELLDDARNIDEGGVKNKLIDRNYLTNLRHQFILAKKWIGIAAVNITNLSLRQKSPVYLNRDRIEMLSFYDAKFLGTGEIQIQHNKVTTNGRTYASVSGVKTADGKHFISNRLSGFATATVDVAKDPYILKVYSSDLLITTAMFLESIGAGEQGVWFLNQPIIREYVKFLDGKNDRRLYNDANLYEMYEKFPVSDDFNIHESIEFDDLEKNIKAYVNKDGSFKQGSLKNNDQQRLILEEFLKYSKMGRNLFSISQATNYDTSSFRNGEILFRKQIQTQIANDTNLFSSADKILTSTFIGPQEQLISNSVNAIGQTIFKLDTPIVKAITNEMLRPFAENAYISNRDFDQIIQNIKIGLLDYSIQTGLNLDSSMVKRILIDNATSAARTLTHLQLKYKNEVPILNDLEVVSGKNHEGFKTIRLNVNIKQAYDENYYTGLMRQMRDFNQETNNFYNELILVAILQGTKRSKVSIKNILPIEDYASKVTPIINDISLNGLPVDQAYSKGMFLRNHWTNDNLVPVYTPYFTGALQGGRPQPSADVEKWGEMNYQFVTKKFADIKHLGVTARSKQVLMLKEGVDNQFINNDLIKIPRTIRQIGIQGHTGLEGVNYIDFSNGVTIPYAKVKSYREKGDNALFAYYGYERVKQADGTPLTVETRQGKLYIYKQVNLYGEGMLGNEYYKRFDKSLAKNNTHKIEQELSNNDIVEYFGGISEKWLANKARQNTTTVLRDNAWAELKLIPVYSKAGVNTMRTTKTIESWMHYGNPFTANPKLTHLVKKDSVAEATTAYRNWLLGDPQYASINPQQREWILDELAQGKLVGKTLLYMNNKGAYHSHANELADLVNSNTPIEWSAPKSEKKSVSLQGQPVTKKVIERRITNEDKQFALEQVNVGVLDYAGGTNPRIRIDGLTRDQIKKAGEDIKANKFETRRAKEVIKAIREAKARGYYEYMEGMGGNTVARQVPVGPGKINPNQLDIFDSMSEEDNRNLNQLSDKDIQEDDENNCPF